MPTLIIDNFIFDVLEIVKIVKEDKEVLPPPVLDSFGFDCTKPLIKTTVTTSYVTSFVDTESSDAIRNLLYKFCVFASQEHTPFEGQILFFDQYETKTVAYRARDAVKTTLTQGA